MRMPQTDEVPAQWSAYDLRKAWYRRGVPMTYAEAEEILARVKRDGVESLYRTALCTPVRSRRKSGGGET